jgi:hypothetical protein
MPLRRRFLILFALAAAALSRPVHAQAPASTGSFVPIPTRTYIGINPVGLPFDIGTVEVESAVAPGLTIGGVGSYIDVGDPKFVTGEFKVRYYPGEVVLRGVSIGAAAGLTRFSNKVDSPIQGEGQIRQSLTAPTLGIIVDYNWLYGREQHFLIGTGLGAKRVLASENERNRVDIDRAIFTLRLIIGYAF